MPDSCPEWASLTVTKTGENTSKPNACLAMRVLRFLETPISKGKVQKPCSRAGLKPPVGGGGRPRGGDHERTDNSPGSA